MGNQDRPGGAAALATSRDLDALLLAVSTGNRQTRRLARQNIRRYLRNELDLLRKLRDRQP